MNAASIDPRADRMSTGTPPCPLGSENLPTRRGFHGRRETPPLVQAAWVAVIAIVALALAALPQFWPGRGASDASVAAPAAMTQAEEALDLATHPIVGVWVPTANPQGPPTFEVYHADGTFTSVNAWSGTSVGVWRPTDERSVEFVSYAPNRNLEPGVYLEGQTMLRGTATVASDGMTYTGTFQAELSSKRGNPNTEVIEGTAKGTRLTLDPSVAATPAA